MIVHSYYDEDPRVRREAETLAAAGWRVRVLGLRRPEDERDAVIAGVEVTRLDVQRHQGAGLLTYLLEYLTFFWIAMWTAVRIRARNRVAMVQVHSLPDFLAFAALPLRMAGTPLLLDLHEAMPEFFRTRFPRASNPLVQWALRLQERLSIGISSATLSVNEAMRDRLVGLGVPPAKLTVVSNTPSLARFDRAAHPRRPFAEDGVVRFVYTGALTPTYEVDVAMRALGLLARRRPDLSFRLDLYGRGDSEPTLRELAAGEGIEDRVSFHGRIALDAVPAALAEADIGLAPTRRDSFTELSLSTKLYEYAAMGKPIVATRLPLVERLFGTETVTTYDPGDPASMAGAIEDLLDHPNVRERRLEAALALIADVSWEHEARVYLELVDRLTGGARRSRRPASPPGQVRPSPPG